MSFFNNSTKTVSAVISEIAGSVGAAGDVEMSTRAMNSFNASIQYLHSRADWDFLFTQANPIAVVAPFTVTGVTASLGVASAACPVGHGFVVDDIVTFGGLSAGTRVSATAAGGIGLTSPVVASGVYTATGIRDFYAAPADFRKPYSLRSLGQGVWLPLIRRRGYGRAISDSEFAPGTPLGYDIAPIAAKGKLRLLPPPSAADVLELDYHRRLTLASATADGTTLDMPIDYEPFVIAYAKWHFIVDKSEGRGDQMTTWLTFAENGLRTMLSDQARQPDEDLGFTAGSGGAFTSPNSTRTLDFNTA